MNKRGFVDFEELNLVAVGLGLAGGLLGVIIADRMESGIIMKIISFFVIAIVGYLVSNFMANQ